MSATTATLRIDGFAHGGRGVARLDGKAVFVAGALPGELVEATITQDRRRFAEAEVLRVLEPAGGRVEPPCPYVPDCGGCDLQHATPGLQRDLKRRVVTEQLERLGGQVDPPVAACLPVGPDLGYRANVQLHPDRDGRLGFHRARSHDVVPIERCLVAADAVNDVLAALPGAGGAEGLAIRAARDGVALVILPGPGSLEVPDVPAAVHLSQPDGSTVALRGADVVHETIRGVDYAFGAGDFFQVNPSGATAIVRTVMEAVGDVAGQLAWDLYAGVGLLSIPLAKAGAEVVAVEASRSAARHAAANGRDAEIDLVVEATPVLEYVRREAHTADPPDLVVLDPPRDGAGSEVCRALVDLGVPLVVYVACDPANLARDVRTLSTGGYRLAGAQPLDLFPMTHHVEVVATLVR